MNLLVVPEEGGPARRINVPTLFVKTAAWIIFLVAVGLVVAIFSYSRFAAKALDWQRLADENERLHNENRRIIRTATEVEQSRKVLANIVRSLQQERPTLPDSLRGLVNGRQRGELSPEAVAVLKGQSHSPEQFLAYGLPTMMPVRGFITQNFFEDFLFPERSHRGLDIAGKAGAVVNASASGRIVFDGWTPYFGNCLIIAHRDGYATFYGHNKLNLRHVQEEVKRGEPIALLGTTGRSSAPHVHFEIWKDGEPVDPTKVLQMK